MEYYILTENGRRAIKMLEGEKNIDDANILRHLDLAGNATVEQIAYITHIEESIARQKLKFLVAKRWVWINKTKSTRF